MKIRTARGGRHSQTPRCTRSCSYVNPGLRVLRCPFPADLSCLPESALQCLFVYPSVCSRPSVTRHESRVHRTVFLVNHLQVITVWRSDSALVSINEVNLWPRLVLGWVTVSGFNSRCGTFISVCNQPPRSTQPGDPFVGRRNEYQPKGGDALRLESKGRYGSCVGGR